MKKLFSLLFIANILTLSAVSKCLAQSYPTPPSSPAEIIAAVKNAQSKLQTVYYQLQRTDTLVTGDIRTFTGKVMVQIDPKDPVFGFKFFSKQDGQDIEQVYNGHLGYLVDNNNKTYSLKTSAEEIQNLIYTGGARLIALDFVKLDTSKAAKIELSSDEHNYYLSLSYPDIAKYNLTHRKKTLTIAKSTMLPIAVRQHQTTLGKVQDLYYKIEEAKINDTTFAYNYSSPAFLKDFLHVFPKQSKSLVLSLKNHSAPPFELQTFDGKTIASNQGAGKVMLLDFWEVLCGPCIESIPKVQRLYQQYKGKGLMVYGISNDLKQLSSAKLLATKQKIQFPLLIGNEQLRRDYKFSGTVPLYILIDKAGKIALVSEGYPPNLEEVIQSLL